MRNFKCVLVVLLAIMLCACSNDDNNSSISSSTLDGTTWTAFETLEGNFTIWELKLSKNRYHLYFRSEVDESSPIASGYTSGSEGPYYVDENSVFLETLTITPEGTTTISKTQGTISGKTIFFQKILDFERITLFKE